MYARYEPEPAQRPVRRHVALREGVSEADLLGCARLAAARDGGDVGTWLERTRRHAQRPRNVLMVAESDADGIVAYGRITWVHATDAPDAAPEGYYLGGLVVSGEHRRMGIGQRLSLMRMRYIRRRSGDAWYLVNRANDASIRLHERLGFHTAATRFTFPGVIFDGPGGMIGHRAFDDRSAGCPGCPRTR